MLGLRLRFPPATMLSIQRSITPRKPQLVGLKLESISKGDRWETKQTVTALEYHEKGELPPPEPPDLLTP